MTKVDGFGITHLARCRQPNWRTAIDARGRIQRCHYCGITWAPGDPVSSPRSIIGYKEKKR